MNLILTVLLQQRMIHAFQTLKNFDKVDENKTGAIGFCFGGKCALDLARAGKMLKGLLVFMDYMTHQRQVQESN